MSFQHPVIVLPGGGATTLHDHYPINTEALWTQLLNREYERIAMHPEDHRFEAIEPARVETRAAFSFVMKDLIEALRFELTAEADKPTPVFPFPYDWRVDLGENARQLEHFIDEVVERTALLRHYADFKDDPRVDLVGHSMGGLIIGEYLSMYAADQRVHKVATIGTPHYGTMEALVKLLTGMGNLGGPIPSQREREAARSMPGMYQILPSYTGAIVPQGANAPTGDLFVAAEWQEGVIASLAESVRLRAVKPPKTEAGLKKRGIEVLQELLAGASQHNTRMQQIDLTAAGLDPAEDWLNVLGLGEQTRTVAQVETVNGLPRYVFRDADFTEQWCKAPSSKLTGDGITAATSGLPTFLEDRVAVVVTRKDFEIWELQDLASVGVLGLHAVLPNMNLVQRLVVKHLQPGFTGAVWGRPAPGVSTQAWDPPGNIPFTAGRC